MYKSALENIEIAKKPSWEGRTDAVLAIRFDDPIIKLHPDWLYEGYGPYRRGKKLSVNPYISWEKVKRNVEEKFPEIARRVSKG